MKQDVGVVGEKVGPELSSLAEEQPMPSLPSLGDVLFLLPSFFPSSLFFSLMPPGEGEGGHKADSLSQPRQKCVEIEGATGNKEKETPRAVSSRAEGQNDGWWTF